MTSTASRPMGGQTAYTPWGSCKVQRTMSVTNEAWELWTAAAIKTQSNRSEQFEVLARLVDRFDMEALKSAVLSGDEKEIQSALRGCLN